MEVKVGGVALPLTLVLTCSYLHTHTVAHKCRQIHALQLTTTAGTKKKNLLMLMHIFLFVARGVPSIRLTMGGLLPCKRSPWESLRLIGQTAAARLVPSASYRPSAIEQTAL